jgi:predicted RNase H-like HicB family nuclease
MSYRYSMLIQWSDEDDVFVVSFPEFGPYAKTHGSTYEEAAKSGREVLELLIETYKNEGWRLPKPAKLGTTLKV